MTNTPKDICKRLADWYEADPKRWIQNMLVGRNCACLVGGLACMIEGIYKPTYGTNHNVLWQAMETDQGKAVLIALAVKREPERKDEYLTTYGPESAWDRLVDYNNDPRRTVQDIIGLLRQVENEPTVPAA